MAKSLLDRTPKRYQRPIEDLHWLICNFIDRFLKAALPSQSYGIALRPTTSAFTEVA
jgi:hypothetical protein